MKPSLRKASSWRAPLLLLGLTGFIGCGKERAASPVVPAASAPTPAAKPFRASAAEPAPAPPSTTDPKLLDPKRFRLRAPARFRAKFVTSKGAFVVEVKRAWSPRGADRFFSLLKAGFYRDVRFHRVVPRGLVQFGIHGDPAVNQAWFDFPLADEPRRVPNKKGFVGFASVGANQRRTELLINLKNNREIDRAGVVPFGRVVAGHEVLASLTPPNRPGEPGPVRRFFLTEGNHYFEREFPWVDRIERATLVR